MSQYQFRLPSPVDTTPLLQEALRQRLAAMQQTPSQAQILAPAISQGLQGILGGVKDYQVAKKEAQQKQTVLGAQKAYGDYLSAMDSGSPLTPQQHAMGRQAGLALGIDQKPAEYVDPRVMAGYQEGAKIDGAPIKGTKTNETALKDLAKFRDDRKATAAKAAQDKKQTTGDDSFWARNFRMFAPTNAARGSLIGQAAFGNARADRALTTLNDPKITPQQISAVVNDYAGIMQGGVPHADSMKAMGYDNLVNRFAELKQFVTSKPTEANQPEVVGKLRDMIREIKEVDNQIIKNNLDNFENTNSGYIDRNPEKWAKIRSSVMAGTNEPAPKVSASPSAQKIGRFQVEFQ